jgi:hypothetical protein
VNKGIGKPPLRKASTSSSLPGLASRRTYKAVLSMTKTPQLIRIQTDSDIANGCMSESFVVQRLKTIFHSRAKIWMFIST